SLIKRVTNISAKVVQARYGMFYFTSRDNPNKMGLFAASGVSEDICKLMPQPQINENFAPPFRGEGALLIEDISANKEYIQSPHRFGLPSDRNAITVRSYLAVPVISRMG